MISKNIDSFVYVIALVFFLSLPVLAETGVEQSRLENGLTMVLEENH